MILTLLPQDEARSDLVGIGLAEDVKKGTLGRSGTVVGPGEPPGAWPVPAPGPLPVPSPAPCFSSLPPESQVSMAREMESGLGLQVVLGFISKWAFEH